MAIGTWKSRAKTLQKKGEVAMKRELSLKDVGRRIHSVREERGISIETLAEVFFIDPAELSAIEMGETGPADTLLVVLESAFSVNIDWILTGEGRPRTAGDASGKWPLWNSPTDEAEVITSGFTSLSIEGKKRLKGLINLFESARHGGLVKKGSPV